MKDRFKNPKQLQKNGKKKHGGKKEAIQEKNPSKNSYQLTVIASIKQGTIKRR